MKLKTLNHGLKTNTLEVVFLIKGGDLLNIFQLLLIGHLLGDWLFQSNQMAVNKTSDKTILFVHSLVYALFVSWMMLFVSWYAVIITFIICLITHILLDNRKFVIWWIKNIKRDKKQPQWLVFVLDQCFHLIVLAIIALLI
jgi:hypothetical protein